MRPDEETAEERLYDEFFAAALDGQVDDLDRYFAGRPEIGSELRTKLTELHAMLAGGTRSAERPQRAYEEPDADLPFERLGEFRLIRKLGEGGMGIVYLAVQESLDRQVALKLVRPELAGCTVTNLRFEREAKALARLRHDHIVSVFGYGIEHGVHYFALELVAGRTLRELLADGDTPIETSRVLAWGRQIADALTAAHAVGIVHRDVKPSNILITEDDRAMLLDFGLAREIDTTEPEMTRSFAGSPSFAAPEQVSSELGEIDERTDVYSLGATLYEALTRQLPFEAESVTRLLQRMLEDEPLPIRKLNRALPRDLEVVIQKAMEKRPAHRYASAAAFGADLQAIAEFRPIQARRAGPWLRTRKWVRRNRWLAATGAVVVLAVASLWIAQVVEANERESTAAGLVRDALGLLEENDADRVEAEAAQVNHGSLQKRQRFQRLTRSEIRKMRADLLAHAKYKREAKLRYTRATEMLNRAERLQADGAEVARARTLLYFQQWLDLRRSPDRAATERARQLVIDHDVLGTYAQRITAGSSFSLVTDPPGADVHLFIYRELGDYRKNGGSRLVPVTVFGELGDYETRGALEVVADHGPLRRGDLIVRLDGHRVENRVYVRPRAGARLERLSRIDGRTVRSLGEMQDLLAEGTGPYRFRCITARGDTRFVEATELPAVDPVQLLQQFAVPGLVWRNGETIEFEIPKGVRVRALATPTYLAPRNLVGKTPIKDRSLQPGWYVAVVTKDGYEPARLPFHIDHPIESYSKCAILDTKLRRRGDRHDGFVFVDGGAFSWDEPSFWIMEREVTCAEYLAFLNATGSHARAPRRKPAWPATVDGRYRLPKGTRPEFAVTGVSFEDARAYAAWATRRDAAKLGGAVYDLPRRFEWIRAGKGGDSRKLVHGGSFQANHVNSRFSRATTREEPVASYPIDVSPYGAFDLAGGVAEWCHPHQPDEAGLVHVVGGAWNLSDETMFRIESFRSTSPDATSSSVGFRLVIREKGTDK